MDNRSNLRLRRSLNNRVLALFFASVCAAVAANAPHVRNFGELDGHLYRGAAPSPAALEELQALGVRVVIDLRLPGEGTAAESQQVRRLGMKYVNVPMPAWGAPTQAQLEQIFPFLLHCDSEPVFVHCRRGKDRTGTVLACYRIQHDNWNNERALQEAKSYGMSHMEHAMRSFILHFVPLTLP